MCRRFISAGSASAAASVSVTPVYGLTAVSFDRARPKARVVEFVGDALPVRKIVGAVSAWTVNGVVMSCWVASKPVRLPLTSPIRLYVHGVVTPSHLGSVGGDPTK